MNKTLCLVICENHKKEIEKVIETQGLKNVVVLYMPPNCLFGVKTDWDFIINTLKKREIQYHSLYFLVGSCSKELEDPPRKLKNLNIYQRESCSEFFLNKKSLEFFFNNKVKVICPGNLNCWGQIIKKFGIKRVIDESLSEDLINKILLIDTGVNNDLKEKIQVISDYSKIPYEILPVGLNFFGLIIKNIFLSWILDYERQIKLKGIAKASQQSAQFAMAFDMIGNLTGFLSEKKVIENIFELFTMLFAPSKLAFLSIRDNKREVFSFPSTIIEDNEFSEEEIEDLKQEFNWNFSKNIFNLKISYSDEILGFLKMRGLSFPEYFDRYLNTALVISKVCGLAIHNARTYNELDNTLNQLKDSYKKLGKINEQLQLEITKREQAEENLKQFISTVTHELRTPITVLLQSISNLKEYNDMLTVIQKEKLNDAISRNTTLLSELVEDLLVISRIDEKGFILKWEEYKPLEIIREILELMEPRRKAKEIIIEVDIDKKILLFGDTRKISQIFRIFIDNALKYSNENSKILIKASDHHKNGKIRSEGILIQFIDNGIGISKENIPHLSQRFFRSDNVKDISGTGLGLAIAKELIQLHKGELYFESVYGKGSTFSVFLPRIEESELNKYIKD